MKNHNFWMTCPYCCKKVICRLINIEPNAEDTKSILLVECCTQGHQFCCDIVPISQKEEKKSI